MSARSRPASASERAPRVRKLGRGENLGTVLLEEQLRRKGTTIAEVQTWPSEPRWYVRLYWSTPEEEQDFRAWATAMIKRNHPWMDQRRLASNYGMWALGVGLHTAYECPGTCGVNHPVDPKVRAQHEAEQRRLEQLRSDPEA